MKKAAYLVAFIIMAIALMSCGKQQTVLDYGDAEAFEEALNRGEDLTDKTVSFTINEYAPDSVLGYNMMSGEHLNFVCANNPKVKTGDKVAVKAKEISNLLGSWVVRCEIIDNVVSNANTIVFRGDENPEAAGGTENNQEKESIDKSGYTSRNIGGYDYNVPNYFDEEMNQDGYEYACCPSEENYFATLAFHVESNNTFTQKEFEGNLSGLAREIFKQYKEYEKASYLATVDDTYAWMEEVEDNKNKVAAAILYNEDCKEFTVCMVSVDSTDESNYDYINDFKEMIETAKRTKKQSDPSSQQSESAEESTTDNKNSSGISPEFKTMMDSYEKFFDEYVEIMNSYKKNPTSPEILSKYMDYLGQYNDMMKKMEALKDKDMTTEESLYYVEVTARIEKKLLEVLQ